MSLPFLPRLARSSLLRQPLSSRSAPFLARGLLSSPTSPASLQGSQGGVDTRIFSGVPGFIGDKEVARAVEWQSGLWSRLQAEIRNNPGLVQIKQKWEADRLDITDLLVMTARDPSLTLAFNYASLLLNNSYFLEGLRVTGTEEDVPPLYRSLEDKVGAYAEGIVGGAWLWLVKVGDQINAYDIIPTYGAGTLLVSSRTQRGRADIPLFLTPSSPSSEIVTPSTPTPSSSSPDSESDSSASPASPRRRVGEFTAPTARGKDLAGQITPLAVLNLFESAYLGDKYGVWSREQYARDWFRQLDWKRIADRAAGNL